MPFGIHQLENRDWVFKQNVTIQGTFTFGDAATDDLTVNGDLIVADDRNLHFGTGEDLSVSYISGSNLVRVSGVPWNFGVDDTGLDVKFFGATASKFMVWDESADDLILADAVALQLGGDESTADGFKLEFDGTNALQIDALTANDVVDVGSVTSTDFKLNSAGGTLTWDASADTLAVASVATTFTGAVTVGVDDTGHDVQLFGATAGMHLLWDESADTLKLVGGAGMTQDAVTLTANTDEGAASSIVAGQKNVAVTGVNADANDFIVLPPIANVPIGHSITIACNASSNFEMRTPSTSGTTINNVDSDGTNEYLCTDTDMITVTKVTATGWIGVSYTNLGAVRTAVVPDA